MSRPVLPFRQVRRLDNLGNAVSDGGVEAPIGGLLTELGSSCFTVKWYEPSVHRAGLSTLAPAPPLRWREHEHTEGFSSGESQPHVDRNLLERMYRAERVS